MEQYLNPQDFTHVHLVQEFVSWLNDEKIDNRDYQKLATHFANKEYDNYCVLDWNRYRDKKHYEFDNQDEYHELKENQLKAVFSFKAEEEFFVLIKTLQNTLSLKDTNLWWLNQSLDLIVKNNFLQDKSIGIRLLGKGIK